jgi:ribosomal protein L9
VAETIKSVGTFDVQVKLHKDVTATVKLHVKARA